MTISELEKAIYECNPELRDQAIIYQAAVNWLLVLKMPDGIDLTKSHGEFGYREHRKGQKPSSSYGGYVNPESALRAALGEK